MLRPVVLVLAAVVSFPALAADKEGEELGLELVPASKKIGERRYQSQRDYEATVKFFRDKFKGWKNIQWMREVSLPSVKYIHVQNTAETSPWEGLNVYQLPDGTVRYYVLARKKPSPATATTTTARP